MDAAAQEGVIELKLPSNPQSMRVIRLTSAGVMANAGFSIDLMEDIKLAVEEACHCMMQYSAYDQLRLAFDVKTNQVDIEIRGDGGEGARIAKCVEPQEMHVIECILHSMMDTVRMVRDEAGRLTQIQMSARRTLMNMR